MKSTLQAKTDEFFEAHVEYITEVAEVKSHLRYILCQQDVLEFIIHDTETTSLDPFSGNPIYWHQGKEIRRTWGGVPFCHVLGYWHPDHNKLYCLYADCLDAILMPLVRLVLETSILKVGHNYKFDIQMCHKEGIEIVGPFWDTLTASRLVNNSLFKHDLKTVGNLFAGRDSDTKDKWEEDVKDFLRKEYGVWSRQFTKDNPDHGLGKKEKEDLRDEHVNYSAIPLEIMHDYALGDIKYTWLLFMRMKDIIEEKYPILFDMEMQVLMGLVQTERRGYILDREKAKAGAEELDRRTKKIHAEIMQDVKAIGFDDGFNPGSHMDIKKTYDKLNIPWEDRLNKDNKESANKDVLNHLADKHPFFKKIHLWKTGETLKGRYFDSLYKRTDKDPAVHCSFKSSDTTTGRAACANPNLQNVPNPETIKQDAELMKFLEGVPNIRSLFLTRPGHTNYLFDYSQVEMRVFAIFSQAKELMESFANGVDIHAATAMLVFDDYATDPKMYRQMAKAINFGLIFGIGIPKLAKTIGQTERQTTEFRKQYFDKIPTIQVLKNKCRAQIASHGYVEDMFGKRYGLDQDFSYKAINRAVQGGAANVLKVAMVQVMTYLRRNRMEDMVRLLLTIHDELNQEFSHLLLPDKTIEVIFILKRLMEDVYPITQHGVITEVDIEVAAHNWEDKTGFPIDEYLDVKKRVDALDLSSYLWYTKENTPKVEWFLQ